MTTMPAYCIVLCTCPNEDSASQIAELLVEKRLAACVNIVAEIHSVFRWQGEVAKEREWLLIAKTRAERFDEVRDAVVASHPYELPEIIGVPLSQGLPGYLRWIDESLHR